MAAVFTRRGAAPEQVSAADMDKLHSKIGQLVVGRDFLTPFRQILQAKSPAGQWKPRINCSGRPSRDIGFANALPGSGTKNGEPGSQVKPS